MLAVGDAVRRRRPRSSSRSATPIRPTTTSATLLGGVHGDGALVFTLQRPRHRSLRRRTTTTPRRSPTLGTDAVAGMFCAGELGPVGGRSFLHGFTASILIFADP